MRREEKLNDYDGFAEKFKPKKTTDDCYTPPEIYETVKKYVCNRWDVDPNDVVRPFWPGGDYESFDYHDGAQTRMKAVNAFIRKNKTLDGCPDITEGERRKIEGHWALGWYVGIPYPAYSLSNNNANIKRVRERLEGLRREKSRETTEQEIDLGGLGFTVTENVEEMRLQLFFEGKPEPEVRDILKSMAFRWSPQNGCWQRQLTDNARSALHRAIEKFKVLEEKKNG